MNLPLDFSGGHNNRLQARASTGCLTDSSLNRFAAAGHYFYSLTSFFLDAANGAGNLLRGPLGPFGQTANLTGNNGEAAAVFTGTPGVQVKIEDTVKGFKGIVEGKYDSLPEAAFYMVGSIEQAVEKAKRLAAEAA